LFIDHSRGLNVAAVMCSQKVGIGKDWGNDVWKLLVTVKIPERIQNFDVAGRVGAHPPSRDQLGNGFTGIDPMETLLESAAPSTLRSDDPSR